MKAINAVMNERLRDYETMEKDIDEAVEGLAEDGAAGDPNNPYLLTINNAPTSTRRRVRQAMNLAQRL
jgi:progesterone-induced-blocking factor 1